MRIIIETDGQEGLSLGQEGSAQTSETLEAIDGGGPPGELLEALRGEGAAEGPSLESQFTDNSADADDGGEAPSWLIDVLETAQSRPSGDLPED